MSLLRLVGMRAFRCSPRVAQIRRFSSDEKQEFPFLSHEFTGKKKGKFEGRPDRLGIPDDYPDPPFLSYQERPPYGWMDDVGRRNLNTPMHEADDLQSMWLYDPPPKRYTPAQQALQLFSVLGILVLFTYVCYLYDSRCEDEAVPMQYPRNNLYIERGFDPALEPEVFTDNDVTKGYPP